MIAAVFSVLQDREILMNQLAVRTTSMKGQYIVHLDDTLEEALGHIDSHSAAVTQGLVWWFPSRMSWMVM